MQFYYNADLNLCAERKWVIDYLFYGGLVESREEAQEGLDTCREFEGWYDCEVSDTIAEAMGD